MSDTPPPVIAPPEPPAEDVFEQITLAHNFSLVVNMLGLLARKLGGSVDFTAEDMVSIAGSMVDTQYNGRTNVLRLRVRDLKAPVWDRANVSYVGNA